MDTLWATIQGRTGSATGVQKRGFWKVYRKEVKVEMSFEWPMKGRGEQKDDPGRKNGMSKDWRQEIQHMLTEKSCLAGG